MSVSETKFRVKERSIGPKRRRLRLVGKVTAFHYPAADPAGNRCLSAIIQH